MMFIREVMAGANWRGYRDRPEFFFGREVKPPGVKRLFITCVGTVLTSLKVTYRIHGSDL